MKRTRSTYHDWGDDDFDWAGLSGATDIIHKYATKYGRVGGQIKEKFGCYDEQTEVLTEHGWKFFKDINIKNDKFATLENDKDLVYYKASDYIEYDYSGKMYSISTRGVDLLVTPNHNLYVAKSDINGGENNFCHEEFPFELTTYRKYFKQHKKFNKGADWSGNNLLDFIIPSYDSSWNNGVCIRVYKKEDLKVLIKPWLLFLGWYVAEGCSSLSRGEVSICLDGTDFGKEENEFKLILDQLPFKYSIDRRKSSTVFKIFSKQLNNWLLENCGHLAPNKRTPEFIKQLTPELIKLYLDGLYAGDGHRTKTAYILSTTSKQLSDDVLELLLKSGYCGRISVRDRTNDVHGMINNREIISRYPEYSINWLKNTIHNSSNSHDTKETFDKKEKIIDYSGKVYCVTVPNNILYVRRNGIPVWCGNSVRFYACFAGLNLHNLIYPGYCYSQFPNWLWRFDCRYGRTLLRPFSGLFFRWQKYWYNKAYQKACESYPHLKPEILFSADYLELIKGGKEYKEKFGRIYWKPEKTNAEDFIDNLKD